MSYPFKGDNKALASSISALLALDAKGALAPHGIGEMARQLLEASSARLAEQHQGESMACAICSDLGDQCVECEEAEFARWANVHFAAADYRKTDSGVYVQDWMRHAYGAWCARAALLGFKSTVLSKCVLCDQLQADLTARDVRIDMLEKQVQLADHWLESASFGNDGEPIDHTQEMRDEFRKKMIATVFPDYVEASTHGRLNGAIP